MKFRCEGLSEVGVELIPRDSDLFGPLLENIRFHLDNPPAGSPPPLPHRAEPHWDEPCAAILRNNSSKPVCAWTLIWKFEDSTGETFTSTELNGVGHRPSLLLPFGLTEEYRLLTGYWHTILPGSKRFVTEDGFAGSNADVRPPGAAEMWNGGGISFCGASSSFGPRYPIVSTTLQLDAVFFADGECRGPDSHHLWDQIVIPSAICRDLGVAVKARGVEAIQDFAAIASPRRTPPPPAFDRRPDDQREHERYQLSQQIRRMRGHLGDEKTMAAIAAWADTALPNYRRT